MDAAGSSMQPGRFPGWKLHPLKGGLKGFRSFSALARLRGGENAGPCARYCGEAVCPGLKPDRREPDNGRPRTGDLSPEEAPRFT